MSKAMYRRGKVDEALEVFYEVEGRKIAAQKHAVEAAAVLEEARKAKPPDPDAVKDAADELSAARAALAKIEEEFVLASGNVEDAYTELYRGMRP